MVIKINTSYVFERNMTGLEDIIKNDRKIPLHPGTHLSDMHGLKKLYEVWVFSEIDERRDIVNNIFTEIELFGDIYRNDDPVIVYC